MKPLPPAFLTSLLNAPGYDPGQFLAVHQHPVPVTSVRFNPEKHSAAMQFPFILSAPVPWSTTGWYIQKRPSFTFDPLFHAGVYYVQEASSMFVEQAFRQHVSKGEGLRVLDLCAAPGGKTTHLHQLLPESSMLVSNEVLRQRNLVLQDNVIKWGCRNVIVTNNDAAAFGQLPGFFDIVLIDAPCSGSGLFRRDNDAIDEWSPTNVQMCAQRQRRILEDAMPCLKEGGLLIYSTCSYAVEEDEAIADWLINELQMESLPVSTNPEWNIVTSESKQNGAKGYRFYPDKVSGEGFFLSCFRKRTENDRLKLKHSKPSLASAKEKEIISAWIDSENSTIVRRGEDFHLLHQSMLDDYLLIDAKLAVTYAGVRLGNILKQKFVPDHALALSDAAAGEVSFIELDHAEAIAYLQRKEVKMRDAASGWNLVRHQQQNLGWANVLTNRINNYYPKELRILKQENPNPL